MAPLLAVLAAAVFICSSGNPLYRGSRVGRGGKLFRIWKLRTMTPSAPHLGPGITGRNDPRVTSVGRILRKTKLDELPQFLNVLTGEMTLVGPRPEAPEFVALYNERQRAVLSVKPGITGPVQLNWADESEEIPEGDAGQYYVNHLLDRKIQVDLEYISNRRLLSDAHVIWATAGLLIGRVIAAVRDRCLKMETVESSK